MNLAEWNKLQLDQQQQTLLAEFEYWRNNSNPNTTYAKHHSQILAITGTVEGFLNGLPSRLPNEPEPFEQNALRSKGLLYASHMWSFFRSKFALRLIDNHNYPLQKILKCADEFAWNCYEPAKKAAQQACTLQPDELKEPPLTFFASDAGPYMAQRNALFTAEGIAGHSQDFKQFSAALEQLPVPIIGVPWAQSEYLPAAVVIAHEIGHLIERDFSAGVALRNGVMAISEIDPERQSHWRNWVSELFADTYAILCVGPAYPIALMEYLVAPTRIVEHETLEAEAAKRYPPRSLRMDFNLAVLQLLDLPDEGIGTLWQNAYPHLALPDYALYCQDAVRVAECLLQTPLDKFGGVPIPQVMKMTSDEWQAIQQMAGELLAKAPKYETPAIDRQDEQRFRRWFAAATLAHYQDPTSFAKYSCQRRLWEKLAGTIPGTTRGGVKEAAAPISATTRAAQALLDQFMEIEKAGRLNSLP